jgi:hypothetical protein
MIELIDLVPIPRWCAWRNEPRGDKVTKVPYSGVGREAKSDDLTTWQLHDSAAALAETIVNGSGGGVGFMLGEMNGVWVVGTDLDDCRNPSTGEIEQWAQEVIDRFASYAEVSPSGTGVKIFSQTDPADIPALRKIMGTLHGRSWKRANGKDHPPAIELHISNRYYAVTWDALPRLPNHLRCVPFDDLQWLVEDAGPSFAGKPNPKPAGTTDDILSRLNLATQHNKAIDTALRNAATMRGGSRSEGAFGLGGALRRAGWTYQDMKAVLLACPATKDWAAAADERQFERIWDRSASGLEEPPPEPDALGIWDAGDDDYIIPPRGWLLGTIFCRRFLSSLVADGGVGKTALRVAQLMSLATGRSLTGEHVFLRCKVLIVSLEDDENELRRRVYAVLRHYGLTPADVKGYLFLAAPKGLRLAEMKNGTPAAGALKTLIEQAIEQHAIDVVSLDPFIKSHGFDENSNNAIDFVCTMAAKMAIDRNCTIDLPHHTNKQVSRGPGDADRGRGASSMKDAARLVYTLNPMTTQEAEQFNLSEADRRSLIRMDSGKVNIAPSSHEAIWFRLIGVPLDNGQGIYQAGDNVQTVERWHPPKTWDGLDSAVLNRILDDIEAGCPDGSRYSSANAAKDRAAWKVVIRHASDKTEAQAKDVINTWVKSGTLFNDPYEDKKSHGKPAEGLRVNATKRPS